MRNELSAAMLYEQRRKTQFYFGWNGDANEVGLVVTLWITTLRKFELFLFDAGKYAERASSAVYDEGSDFL